MMEGLNVKYRVLSDEEPDELQKKINDLAINGYVVERLSYATGAGLFYALMVKQKSEN